MSNPISVLTRNIVVKYHLLGLLIITNYLLVAFPIATFQAILPILSAVGLFLITIEFIFPLKRRRWCKNYSIVRNQLHQFIFELSFYLCAGLAVAVLESYFLHCLVNIIAKSVIAIIDIGFYMAMAIAIEIEYARIRNKPSPNAPNKGKIVPAGLKLRYFLLIILAVNWFVFALVYFQNTNPVFYLQSPKQNLQEILFVGVAVVSLSVYLFYLYSRNFIYALGIQVNVLRCMEDDDLDEVDIPIVSDDELALLAVYHNIMLERLRDRKHLYRTLEKSVGSDIMNKLLTTDEQTLKQGQIYSVAILFCDLRGFTSLGESASAEEVILFLNDYFADVSSVISQHHGIINKFMGDAVLAIFGLENERNSVEDAVKASLAIIQHNVDFYMPNEMHPETGVGIDFGSVIGGTIGSEERYEYTIIGDAVNKASRLEGLSKRLDYSIILSEAAYQQICDGMRESFCDLGAHKVRGRQESIKVYGCGKKQVEAKPLR
jgi:class 3 adenylate cyclase